jgi:hypothetical protein
MQLLKKGYSSHYRRMHLNILGVRQNEAKEDLVREAWYEQRSCSWRQRYNIMRHIYSCLYSTKGSTRFSYTPFGTRSSISTLSALPRLSRFILECPTVSASLMLKSVTWSVREFENTILRTTVQLLHSVHRKMNAYMFSDCVLVHFENVLTNELGYSKYISWLHREFAGNERLASLQIWWLFRHRIGMLYC